jgi:hypothetical protein
MVGKNLYWQRMEIYLLFWKPDCLQQTQPVVASLPSCPIGSLHMLRGSIIPLLEDILKE